MADSKVSMGVYLWKRLVQLGIEHVFGVPGDFNRKFHSKAMISSILTHQK